MDEGRAAAHISEPSPEADRARPFYKPELDGLRFVAFFLVFCHHSLPNDTSHRLAQIIGRPAAVVFAGFVRGGGYGVDVFFVLSSYLITELLFRERDKRGKVDVVAFYMRRMLRIWPLYFFFLIGAGIVLPALGCGSAVSRNALLAFSTFVANWYVGIVGYPHSSIGPLWSVSLEEQFYILWPLVIRSGRVQRIGRIAIGMMVVSLVYRIVLTALGAPPLAVRNITLGRLDAIAGGILLAVLMKRHPTFDLPDSLRPLAAAFGIGCLTLAGLCWPAYQGYTFSCLAFPIVTAGSLALMMSARRQKGRSLLARRPLVYLGRISYGLYVFHGFALGVSAPLAARCGLPPVAAAPVALLLTVALAAVCYQLLERPFLRLKSSFTYVPSRAP